MISIRRNSRSNNSKMIKSSTKSSIMCNSRSKLEILVYNRKYTYYII